MLAGPPCGNNGAHDMRMEVASQSVRMGPARPAPLLRVLRRLLPPPPARERPQADPSQSDNSRPVPAPRPRPRPRTYLREDAECGEGVGEGVPPVSMRARGTAAAATTASASLPAVVMSRPRERVISLCIPHRRLASEPANRPATSSSSNAVRPPFAMVARGAATLVDAQAVALPLPLPSSCSVTRFLPSSLAPSRLCSLS